jgi:hypothetical protein
MTYLPLINKVGELIAKGTISKPWKLSDLLLMNKFPSMCKE